MLADARAGEFEVILAYSGSRLTRRDREKLDLIDLYLETGVRCCTIVSGDDDLDTADGRFAAKVKGAADAAEAERTRERLMRRQQADRAKGVSKGRRAWGWGSTIPDPRHPKRRLVVDADRLNDTEGPALVDALIKIREGVGLAYIARDWNFRNLSRISGKPWTTTRVREVLIRWHNAGVLQHLGEPVEGVQGSWEAACTRQELDTVRALLLDPERRSDPGPAPTLLLSGVAVCGACGRTLYGGKQRFVRKDGPVWFQVYRCSGSQDHTGSKCFLSIKVETLDKIVLAQARTELYFGKGRKMAPTQEERERVDSLRAERVEIVAEEAHFGALLGKRVISVVGGTAALQGLQERRTAIDTEVASITARYPLAALFSGSVAELRGSASQPLTFDRAGAIHREFSGLDVSQQREIIRAMFPVVVNPGRDPESRVYLGESAEEGAGA